MPEQNTPEPLVSDEQLRLKKWSPMQQRQLQEFDGWAVRDLYEAHLRKLEEDRTHLLALVKRAEEWMSNEDHGDAMPVGDRDVMRGQELDLEVEQRDDR